MLTHAHTHAHTSSHTCLLCNLRRSKKANITSSPANTTARTRSPDPVYEAPDDVVDQIEMKENAIYTNMGQRYGGPPSSSRPVKHSIPEKIW